MKGWTTMQDEKQFNFAFLGYISILLMLGVCNLIDNASIIDYGYLFIIVCCLIKYLLILNEKRK